MAEGRGSKGGVADAGTAREPRAILVFRQRGVRFWILAAVAWVILLYGTLGIVRPITTWLRDHDFLRLFLVLVVAAVAALISADLWRRRPRGGELRAYALSLLLYAVALADSHLYQAIEERLHLIEYGVLGWLVWRALHASRLAASRRSLGASAVLTLAVVSLVGLVDEGIQSLLPSRVGDWRDVTLDVFSGLLIVVSSWLVTSGRRHDELASPRVSAKR